ncbi:MAG TPA: outer membrane beta-barrel protein [Burkholderiales bacterium]|nr:outer membrane beta-barrel protein [Burkholderiales bacterium]
MNRLRASLLHGSIVALAAACGLPCAGQAQVASPPPGKALVVMYRADKQPVAARVPAIANADRLGDIGNGEFVNAVVNPGRTFLRVGDKILTTLAIQTSANRTSYVLIQAVPGLSPVRVEMREMDEASARRVLAQSRPAGAGAAAAPRVAAAAPAPRSVVAPAVPLAAPRAAPPPKPAAPPPPARAQAAPPPPPAPRRSMTPKEPPPPVDEEEEQAAERSKWSVAIIAKTGAFKLSTVSQSIGGLMTSYDKSSKPVAAFEVEFRHKEGFAIGAEALYYKNSLTAPGAGTTFAGDQTVISGMVNGKYYFGGDSGTFHPFVGAGFGFAGAAFSGDIQGKSSGPSFQGMAGADLRFGDFGLYLEYKYVSATTQDSANQKIKVGGSGILAGVSIAF